MFVNYSLQIGLYLLYYFVRETWGSVVVVIGFRFGLFVCFLISSLSGPSHVGCLELLADLSSVVIIK